VIYASNGEQVLYTGEVARIDPIVDSEVRTFRVYVEIDAGGADSPIPPGQHVVADISGAVHEDVIAVPREAFLDDLIYVAEPAGQGEPATARGIRPTIRRMLAGVALVAPEGGEDALQSGDEVVVSNLEDIAEGSKLRIAPPVGATGGR
jgi:multidrug efflux pump subunit AcrA (membrane-fusion protein)